MFRVHGRPDADAVAGHDERERDDSGAETEGAVDEGLWHGGKIKN